MVRTVKSAGLVAGVAVYLLLLVGGCRSTGVELALKLRPPQATVYRATTEVQKSIEWKGEPSAKPAGFIDGRSGHHAQVTYEQRVQQVRDDGSAVVEITIAAVKYLGEVRSNVVFDFDSGRAEDRGGPLAALLGRSYKLQMSPSGRVLALLDVEPVRQAVQGASPAHEIALKLLSEESIRDRHEIAPLTALQENPVQPGQSWSDTRMLSFGSMGLKSYERVYTLQPVQRRGGPVAVVEMKAIPSAVGAAEVHSRQMDNPFSRMFDNIESYEGRLELDLQSGQVREYLERVQVEWVIADPTAVPEGGQPAAAFKMAERRLHRLERVSRPGDDGR